VVELTTPVGYVTFDLGEPREISALYLQGDANDVYRASGSLDGSPGTFRPLAEFPSAIAKGHGLRDRTLVVSPTKVRYLRVGEPTGDSYFSISEVGAYCERPTPFPPTLRADDSPPPVASTGETSERWSGFMALYGVALAALGWLVSLMIRSADASGRSSSRTAEAQATTMKNTSNGMR
jgi:hypothetical protein